MADYLVRLEAEGPSDAAGQKLLIAADSVPGPHAGQGTMMFDDEAALLDARKRAEWLSVARVVQNAYFTVPYVPPIGAAGFVEKQNNWGDAYLLGPALRSMGCDGEGVRIGIADTGIDTSHPVFDHLQAVTFGDADLETGKIAEVKPYDSGWHGTFCSSILFGIGEAGLSLGLAPKATPVVAKCLNGWNGSVASISAAIRWLTSMNVHLMSLSLGWPGLHDEWTEDIAAATSRGIMVVAASGNEYAADAGDMKTRSPGNYPIEGLLSVGAHNVDQIVWDKSGGGVPAWPADSMFSSVEPQIVPALVAPGVNVPGASPAEMYRTEAGSSMAVPHIAGLIAALLSGYWRRGIPRTAREVASFVMQHLTDGGTPGADQRFGRGFIDSRALLAATKAELG